MRTPTLAALLLHCVACQNGAPEKSAEAPTKEAPKLNETIPDAEDEDGPGPRLLTPEELEALLSEDDTEADAEETEADEGMPCRSPTIPCWYLSTDCS